MNRFYEIIGELKICEICEHFGLSYAERTTLRDVFVRLDAVEKFLEEDEDLIRDAKADIIASALKRSPRGAVLWDAITSICDEFLRIKDAVYQLKDLRQEGMLLQ